MNKHLKQTSVFYSITKIILSVVLLFVLSCTSVFAENEGASFSAGTLYKSAKPLSQYPLTFEATVKLPEDYSGAGGIILGNHKDGKTPCFSFSIEAGGKPRVFWIDNNGTHNSVEFGAGSAALGEWVHIAITIDPVNDKVYYYRNGIPWTDGASLTTYPDSIDFTTATCLGGDLRTENTSYFKGEIKDVTIYNNFRTRSQINSDKEATTPNTDGLIAAYKMPADSQGSVRDLSGNGNDLSSKSIETWITNEIPLDDYAYSFAVVGDTQIINRVYPQYLGGIYDWIIDNAEKYNTKFVFGLGDITDWDMKSEWALAQQAINNLNGIVPYSIVRGNHDSAEKFNEFFPYSKHKSQISGSMDGTMLNTYQKFNVGKIKYLALNLDFGAPDDVLAWADDVISDNQDRNVIITTHAYLSSNGTTLDASEGEAPTEYNEKFNKEHNNGDDMWNELIKKHENIVLVLSGHIPYDKVVMTQTKGEKGNTVTQMLIDPQSTDNNRDAAGLVAMLHFSEDGKNVQLRYYSTVKKAYFLEDNQYSFTVDTVDSEAETPKIETNNLSFNVGLNEGASGKIIAALYKDNQLISSKVYDADKNVPVSFEDVPSDSILKVFWWDGLGTIVPVTPRYITTIDTE